MKNRSLSIYLGNFFEHYDTALFSFLSPFLAPLFFPEKDAMTALILTYALIPLGMLTRPLGSLFFGRIAENQGREQALFLTLTGMAVVSGCMAFCPTYAQAGMIAPLLFLLGRMFQNFLAAGETVGGALLLLENAEEKNHGQLSSFYSASTMGGHLLASFAVFLISQRGPIDPLWRFLYLFGCVVALFGCKIRRSSTVCTKKIATNSLKTTLWTYRKQLMLIIITSGFSHATYSIALILLNGFIPLVSTISKAEVMKMNTYLLVLDLCSLPVFGYLASKLQREKLMFIASLGVVLFSIPLLLSLNGASQTSVLLVRSTFVLLGTLFFAPFHAWAQKLLPFEARYSVISFGYALGSQLLGGPTASIALYCFKKTGMISSIGWYWMLLALGSSFAIWSTLPSKNMKWYNTNFWKDYA